MSRIALFALGMILLARPVWADPISSPVGPHGGLHSDRASNPGNGHHDATTPAGAKPEPGALVVFAAAMLTAGIIRRVGRRSTAGSV
jgi:hypothetical protein